MLDVMERAMVRRMLGVTLPDNQTLHQMSGVKDNVVATREYKIRWAGDIARFVDNR